MSSQKLIIGKSTLDKCGKKRKINTSEDSTSEANLMETKKKILLVDDDPSLSKILKTILQNQGYAVDTAETGKEALERFQCNFYDLALIDMKLPDISGADLLSMVCDSAKNTIKIVITGYPTSENKEKSFKNGANDFLVKPINPERLLEIIRNKLKKQSLSQRDWYSSANRR